MPKVICAPCQRQFKPEKNGVIAVELYANNTLVYRIFRADLLRCPECGSLIVAGFAQKPYMANWTHSEEDLRQHIKEVIEKGGTVIFDKELIGVDLLRYTERELSKLAE